MREHSAKAKELMKAIGSNVRAKRKQRYYTLKQLAALAGIHWNYLGRLELGKENPKIGTLQQICDVLEIEVYHLLLKPKKDTQ